MKMPIKIILPPTLLLLALLFFSFTAFNDKNREKLANEMEHSIQTQLLNKWYPSAIDSIYGGYLSNFSHDFHPEEKQEKMIVSQARHLWTTSKSSIYYPENKLYLRAAKHGFEFLKEKFWDGEYGGFYTLLDQKGNLLPTGQEIKTAYGNAFAIFGLAAYYQATQDTAALNLAKEAFWWLENHSHDPIYKGYYQSLALDGSPLKDRSGLLSTSQIGYKDQNSSIHLLEAFTELYAVWPDELLKERLEEMLYLIRDTLITDKGYLQLFFQPNWIPVSYRDSSETAIEKHHSLDHVSFGHDVETAYLMLEASHILGIENDPITLEIAKKMVDHALQHGWDKDAGGFYDGGYYFKGDKELTIVKDSKNWWAQAECLNTLLIMADLFPDDKLDYFDKFQKQWDYIQKYMIDQEHGEWYSGGLDKEPHHKMGRKGHIWKTPYHNFRSLANCVQRLKEGKDSAL